MWGVVRVGAGASLILGVVTACSSVKTYEHPGNIPHVVKDDQALGREFEGVTYFLPRRRMLLTVTAKFIPSPTKKEVDKAFVALKNAEAEYKKVETALKIATAKKNLAKKFDSKSEAKKHKETLLTEYIKAATEKELMYDSKEKAKRRHDELKELYKFINTRESTPIPNRNSECDKFHNNMPKKIGTFSEVMPYVICTLKQIKVRLDESQNSNTAPFSEKETIYIISALKLIADTSEELADSEEYLNSYNIRDKEALKYYLKKLRDELTKLTSVKRDLPYIQSELSEVEKMKDVAKIKKHIKIIQEKIPAKKIQGIWKSLALNLEEIRLILDGACSLIAYDLKLKIQAPEPDPRHIYQAVLRHYWTRDDELTITTNDMGLLNNTKLTTTDRTADILVEIAGAVATFVRPFPSAMPGGAELLVSPQKKIKCPQPFKFQQIFDPVSYTELFSVNKLLEKKQAPLRICVDGKWKEKGGNCSQITMDEAPCQGPGCTNARDSRWRSDAKAAQQSKRSRRQKRRMTKRADGLLYRRTLPHVIEIQERKSPRINRKQEKPSEQNKGHSGKNGQLEREDRQQEWLTREAQLVMLPNAGPISVVPFRAGPMVKTVYDVQFKDGILTKWDANRPSELLEVVRLPIRILKAIISVPAEIFQLRVNLTQKETSLLEAQAKQIEATRKLTELQQQIARETLEAQQSLQNPQAQEAPGP